MSSKIRLLSDSAINQIAAGEVVERPASVVKELIENAIDAKATKIEVVISDGGKQLIGVSDNGVGMSEQDAILSVARHTTSKISSGADLVNVMTYGFRGEALASIAAISILELKSRNVESQTATCFEVRGGQPGETFSGGKQRWDDY